MSTFKHPTFPDILHRCADDLDDDATAKGWVPLLDSEQKARLQEIELEVELTPQTPPPAVRKPIGPGRRSEGNKA